MQDITIIQEVSTLKVVDQTTLTHATEFLSRLNTSLDTLIAEKEKVTKPLNEALKQERARFKPLEVQLEDAIATVKQSITTYATEQVRIAKEQEQKILADKRTNLDTKIQKLSTVDNTATEKVTTDTGSITFVTVKKWKLIDISKVPLAHLQVNEDTVKQAMKENHPIEGIEYYEEQNIRNYRG